MEAHTGQPRNLSAASPGTASENHGVSQVQNDGFMSSDPIANELAAAELLASPPQEGVLGLILDFHRVRRNSLFESTAFYEGNEEEFCSRTCPYPANLGSTDQSCRSERQSIPRQALSTCSTFVEQPSRKGLPLMTSTATATAIPDIEKLMSHDSEVKWCAHGTRRPSRRLPGHERTAGDIAQSIRLHLGRHLYLLKLCRALMIYGAPTHRLEA